jgi:hypothetical protein
MIALVLGAILVVLVVLFLATFWSLSARVDRLAEANAVLLDLVSTHITLTAEERARLSIATGERAAGR